MSLRTKLLVSLGVVIVLGVGLASLAVYVFARAELERTTRTHLEQSAEMLAKQSEGWLKEFKSDVGLWAGLPAVRHVAENPGDRDRVLELSRSLSDIVDTHSVYQSINLHTPDASCIASSIESRIGLKIMQEKVATRPDFRTAAAGRLSVSSTIVSRGTGRACIAISSPVRHGKRIVGVLRATVDLALYSEFVLRRQKIGYHGKASILDLDTEARLPEDFMPMDAIRGKPYSPPGIPRFPGKLSADRGLVSYKSEKGDDYLAAFQKIREPAWIIVVEEPVREVLAPIRSLGKATLLTAIFLLVAVAAVVFIIVNPRLRDVLRCVGLARTIEFGDLGARLHLETNDEIGVLAGGLNRMAESLDRSRRALEGAERTYRGIFENALEGIFQASADQRIITANPAFARILGYGSPEEVAGAFLSDHFADPDQKEVFLSGLHASGVVRAFELALVKRDGSLGLGSLFARMERDEKGDPVLMQGILADMTEKRKAEIERTRAEKAENLLTRSRLEALRYQLNPHFLFNVLNSIDALSRQAPERVPDLVRELSRYLRSTLTDRGTGLVPLSREIDVIRSYLKLEAVRFEENLVTDISLSPEDGVVLVPELLIQPLVENAVKYGMKTSAMPLRVAVRCGLDGERLRVEVSNTGRWVDEEGSGPGGHGIGLKNLRGRLDLLFPGKYDLTVEQREDRVTVKIELPSGEVHDHAA